VSLNNQKHTIMKIYLLKQRQNTGWDTFDSCVVCAESTEDARMIHPYDREFVPNDDDEYAAWAFDLDAIEVTEIGTANEDQKRGVICASFNAG
jgi:hypothetical protein